MKMQTFQRHAVFLVHFVQETGSAKYYEVLTTSTCRCRSMLSRF